MKNEDKKKGLFGGLLGGKKNKKGTGCCNLEIEEIQEDAGERVKEKDTHPKTKKSCCS